MILYNIGKIECKLEWDKFLSLVCNGKLYKTDFEEFSELYEYIDKNIKNITKITFDNYEYTLKNGVLHNLYKEAHFSYNKNLEGSLEVLLKEGSTLRVK